MSSKTIDTTLEFSPSLETTGKPRGVLFFLKGLVDSASVGLAASRTYETLLSQGTRPDEAVNIVYRKHFAKLGE